MINFRHPCRPPTSAVLAALFTYAAIVSAVAHEGHDHGDQEAQQITGAEIEVTGVVYQDLNGNRQRDADEPGIEGVRVSNGLDITLTDSDGKYSLMIDDDQIVFMIKPKGFRTPVNDDQLPQFYYIHKPAGSPASRFPGVEPTGPLPESVDFPLYAAEEPDQFRAIMFGDPQPRDLKEVDYISHDVVAQIVREQGHQAAFGVTLGDIAFDNLDTMQPLNRSIALIGIPWYNVIGNHDLNYEAKVDEHSDETFERIYGPSYYSFDYGQVHFLVLDDVRWSREEETGRGKYVGGLGETQMQFIRNDLALIPEQQMVVLMMHIPLTNVEDRQQLYRLIEQRPFALSFSAHTHYQQHVLIGEEDGWQGPERHHHVVNVTVCGSWWRGAPDENGIPHATMSDGGPNGYSIITFDGNQYKIEQRAARRPADHQMNIYTANAVAVDALAETEVIVNVFGGSERSKTEIRFGDAGDWIEMKRVTGVDPFFRDLKASEQALSAKLPPVERGDNLPWIPLPGPHQTNHLWVANLASDLSPGICEIQVRTTDMFGQTYTDARSIRVLPSAKPNVDTEASTATVVSP
jgi:3',5'-cyclic AMP phosphodiesterase CpdA